MRKQNKCYHDQVIIKKVFPALEMFTEQTNYKREQVLISTRNMVPQNLS